MLQVNELDEMRRESYESSRIYKEKVKLFHDKNIVRKTFEPQQKVLLYSSRFKFSQANSVPSGLALSWSRQFIPMEQSKLRIQRMEKSLKSMISA